MESIGIEGGDRGHGQDGAIGRVHHHHRAARGVISRHRVGEGAFGDELDDRVDGQHDIGAIDGAVGPFAADQIHPFARVAQQGDAPGAPSHMGIERMLDAGKTFPVQPNVSDDVCGERPAGVGTPMLVDVIDAREPQFSDSGSGLQRYLSRDPDEPAPGGKLFLDLIGAHLQCGNRCQRARGVLHVGDGLWICVDRFCGHALREHASARVEDGTAKRTESDGALLLPLRLRDVLTVANQLHLNQPAHHHHAP